MDFVTDAVGLDESPRGREDEEKDEFRRMKDEWHGGFAVRRLSTGFVTDAIWLGECPRGWDERKG